MSTLERDSDGLSCHNGKGLVLTKANVFILLLRNPVSSDSHNSINHASDIETLVVYF